MCAQTLSQSSKKKNPRKMSLRWHIKDIPSDILFTHVYALFIPRTVFDGNDLSGLLASDNPLTKAYAMIASVFFKFVDLVEADKELKCESVMDGVKVLGYRYFFILTSHPSGNYDPDKLIRDEIVLFFKNEGKNQKKKFKRDLKDFSLLWRTMFGGLGDWVKHMEHVFPDHDIHDVINHIAKDCFTMESAGCDDSYEEFDSLTFPNPKYVMDIPMWTISTVSQVPLPDVYLEQLRLQRYHPKIISHIARAFQEDEEEEPALRRRRVDRESALIVTDEAHKFLPFSLLKLHINKVFSYIDSMPDDDKQLKVLMKEFCLDKFCDSFMLEFMTSSKRSPADKAYYNFSKKSFYFEGKDVPLSSNVWIKKSLNAESFTGSKQLFFYKIFLAAMDAFHDMDRNHSEVLRLNLFARDATRLEFSSMHLSEFMHSSQGGVGKSHIIMMVFLLAIELTATKVNRFTPASFAVHGTAENPNNPNQCGMINIGDDWDPAIFSDDPKQSQAQAAFKTILSDGLATVQALALTEDHVRVQTTITAPVIGSWLICSNASQIKSHPMKRRANDTSASEAPSSTLSSTILESWTNQLSSLPGADMFIRQCQASQYWTYWIHQLQYCGMLNKFTMDGSVRFINAVFEYLKRSPECPWFSKIDASFLSRLKALAKVLTIDYITMDSFSRLEDKEITIRDVMKLKPRMWVPVEQMASAAFFLIEEWFSPLKFAVFDALKRLIRKQVEDCHDHFKELFWADYIDNKKIPDYNWLRLSKDDAAQKVAQEVCDMMGGNFVPNPKKIEEIFDSFTQLAPKKVPEYYLAREYPKTLGRVTGTEKQKTLFNVEKGLKLDYLKISVYYFEDLLVMDGIEKPFEGLGPSFYAAYLQYSTSEDLATRLDFEMIAHKKTISELKTPYEIKPAELEPIIDDWVDKSAKNAATQMSNFLNHINPDDVVKDPDYLISQLRESVFWSSEYEGKSWKEIVTQIKANRVNLKSFLVQFMEPKYRFLFDNHYDYDYRSRCLIKKRTMGEDYAIHWFRNNERKEPVINEEEESYDYKTRAHDLVEKAMKAVMGGKNQFERTVYAGTDPDKPWLMRSFAMGDVNERDIKPYDSTKGFTFKVKNRRIDELGAYFKSQLPESEEDAFISYDLDIYSQEIHLENMGMSDTIITEKVFEEISSRMLSSSTQEEWQGKYLHGVEMTELVPLSSQDAAQAATNIRHYVNRLPEEHLNDDLYFPADLAKKQDPIIEKIGLKYFHMDDLSDSQTTCWIPFLCNLVH